MAALLSIWLIHLAALVSPGPQMVFIVFLSSSGQGRAARFAIIGIAFGALIWSSSAILGVHALFELLPEIRFLIQLLGASYLIYLAIKLWKSKPSVNQIEGGEIHPAQAVVRGFLVNMTNPKAALFYGSVFSTTLPSTTDRIFLVSAVAVVLINCVVWHYLVSILCSHPSVQSRFKRFEGVMKRLTSAVFGVFGAALLASTVREIHKGSS